MLYFKGKIFKIALHVSDICARCLLLDFFILNLRALFLLLILGRNRHACLPRNYKKERRVFDIPSKLEFYEVNHRRPTNNRISFGSYFFPQKKKKKNYSFVMVGFCLCTIFEHFSLQGKTIIRRPVNEETIELIRLGNEK